MITGLNHITLAVSDLEKSLTFYSELLNFKPLVKWRKGAYLSLGDLWLCLSLGSPDQKLDYTHLAFSLDNSDFPRFAEKLEQMQVSQWQKNTSEGDSLYFLDPDGHKLEVHLGGLKQRLDSLKQQPYQDLEWF